MHQGKKGDRTRERKERQTDGESVRWSESNRELNSKPGKLVLRCSRVVCIRLEEH